MTPQPPTKPLGIVDLLKLRGFDADSPTKLVRHKETRKWDMEELRRNGWLEVYQAFQADPVFHGCDHIVSFIGTDKTKARLFGVYRVLKKGDARQAPRLAGLPPKLWKGARYYYRLEREAGYEDLEGRAIIDWGDGAINWHQWLRDKKKGLNNKEVVELLPKGQSLPPFRDYLEFTLTHAELKELYKHEDANMEWHTRLAAVAGIYLILATTTGKQYVGSAHGTAGFWGRWADYARNGHGGNKHLRDLVRGDPAYPDKFSYSILQVLPKTWAQKEVRAREQLFMRKLGSRATGLNC